MKQRETNWGVPKLFRSKEEHTEAFQNLQEQRETKRSVPKLFRNKDKQMDLIQIIADLTETNKFDIEKATKKSGKNECLFFF